MPLRGYLPRATIAARRLRLAVKKSQTQHIYPTINYIFQCSNQTVGTAITGLVAFPSRKDDNGDGDDGEAEAETDSRVAPLGGRYGS